MGIYDTDTAYVTYSVCVYVIYFIKYARYSVYVYVIRTHRI